MIIFSGPSTVGKNFALEALADAFSVEFVVPLTSRTPRSAEVRGRDYTFVAQSEFQDLIRSGSLAAWDYALDHYYGFFAGAFDRFEGRPHVTHALARMAIRIRSQYRDVRLIFLRPRDTDGYLLRLAERFPDQDEFARRQSHWQEELVHAPLFDRVLDIDAGNDVCTPQYQDLWSSLGLVGRSAKNIARGPNL